MTRAQEMGIAAGLVSMYSRMEKQAGANTVPAGVTSSVPPTVLQGVTPGAPEIRNPTVIQVGPSTQPQPLSDLPPTMPAPVAKAAPVATAAPAAGGWQNKVLNWWANVPPDARARIMNMLLIGGVGGGLIGLLRSQMRPQGQRSGLLGSVGSMLGYGLLGAGLGGAGAYAWPHAKAQVDKARVAFGSSNTPKPAATIPLRHPDAPARPPSSFGNAAMTR